MGPSGSRPCFRRAFGNPPIRSGVLRSGTMKSELKKTIGHSGIYTLGIVLNRIISIAMLPVYTRYLTPADYGVLEMLEITVDVVSIVAGLGILNGLSKYYYLLESEEERNKLVSTLFVLVIVFYLAGCLMGGACSQLLSKIVFKGEQHSNLIAISFLNLFLQIVFHANMSYLQTQKRSLSFIVFSSLNVGMKLALNILFVIYLKMGVIGVLYSAVISFIVLDGIMTFRTFSRVGFHFSRETSKELIKFGYPFVLSGLCAFVTTYSDRFFLNHYTNLSNVGIYSLGYKFGFLLMMFPVQPMMSIWMVQRFELVKNKDYKKIFNKFLSWFVIAILTVALTISLFIQDVLQLMSAPAFWEAYKIVPIILLAYFFQACTDFFDFGIYHSGKTKHMAYGTFTAAIVVVAFNFLLIPKFGIYGAAWATLIGFIARLIYYYHASQMLYKIEFLFRKPVTTLSLAVMVFIANIVITGKYPYLSKNIVSLIFSALSLFLFITSLFVFKIIDKDERIIIVDSLRSPIKLFKALKNI
jgi:O-antigen/teichoic acid export membrane protein